MLKQDSDGLSLLHAFCDGTSHDGSPIGCERIWLVTFMHCDLGYFDDQTCRLEPIENRLGPQVLQSGDRNTPQGVVGASEMHLWCTAARRTNVAMFGDRAGERVQL
jgi:hypothetical protein